MPMASYAMVADVAFDRRPPVVRPSRSWPTYCDFGVVNTTNDDYKYVTVASVALRLSLTAPAERFSCLQQLWPDAKSNIRPYSHLHIFCIGKPNISPAERLGRI